MPLPKKLDPIECKIIIRSFNEMDSASRNHSSYNGSFNYFDRLGFQSQT